MSFPFFFISLLHSADECSKYGPVKKVVIYTEKQGEDDAADQIVKIFVEFQDSKGSCSSQICMELHFRLGFLGAEKSSETLNGRYFGGRKIKAELYDQTAYQAEDFSG